MRRRGFLKATIASALGASAVETACASRALDVQSAGPYLTRSDFFPQSVASGDPRPDSVVLWTRLADLDAAGDRALWLEVALDETFQTQVTLEGGPELALRAETAFDHCVKARITNLSPDTYYYYRFLYDPEQPEPSQASSTAKPHSATLVSSRVGRTKTAPSPESNATLRFGVLSCQDYIGRYYHALAWAATLDWDFFLHLGDYVYETTGDPQFQQLTGARAIQFDDVAGALTLVANSAGPVIGAAPTPSVASPEPLPDAAGRLDAAANSVGAGNDGTADVATSDSSADGQPQDGGGASNRATDAAVSTPHDSAADADAGAANGEVHYLAAASLDNYRQLYRTVRGDPNLQRLHETCPMIATLDDHEFSNDCYGAHANYSDGRSDETSVTRRLQADHAWWEYMPIDVSSGSDAHFDADAPFPDNLTTYRDFHFGKHVHVVMTDLRRYRSDHVIPENALPARVAVTQEQLITLYGALPDTADAYVDIAELENGSVQRALRDALAAGLSLPLASEQLSGLLHAETLNQWLTLHNQFLPQLGLTLIDTQAPDLKRGYAYVQAGKTQQYSSIGARQLVINEVFEAIAGSRYLESQGESEQVMGPEQEAWFTQTLTQSAATWKIWGNPYTLMPRLADLREVKVVDPSLRHLFRVFADDWDGFPNRRSALLGQLSEVNNLVAVTGDIHSFFAGEVAVAGAPQIFEFVAGAISSATYQSLLETSQSGAEALSLVAPLAGSILQQSNPHIAYQNLRSNGFAALEISQNELNVVFHQLEHPGVLEAELSEPLAQHFELVKLRLRASEGKLMREVDGAWKTWDRTLKRFV